MVNNGMRGESALFLRLRRRLTLVCTASTCVILICMAAAALLFSRSQLQQKGEAAFQRNVSAVLIHLRGQTVLDHAWISQTEADSGVTLYLELSGQPLLYHSEHDDLVALARKTALLEHHFDLSEHRWNDVQTRQVLFRFQDGVGLEYRAAAATVPVGRGWTGVLVIQSLAAEQRELTRQVLAFGSFTVLALILLALFAWLFIRRAMEPLMESRRRQSAFIAAASHELRSPLAVVHSSLEAARNAPADKARHFISLADGECMRMSRLVGDMLALANADSGTWSLSREMVEPETLLLEAAESFEETAHQRGIKINLELPPEALPRCNWDCQRIAQVLAVLLDNGISYTPVGGHIHLSASMTGENIRLTVADSGPGIPEMEREKIFERFYRYDQSRTDREHYGLGLCIAKEIVELHGGRIRVEEASGGGAVFVTELPVHL